MATQTQPAKPTVKGACAQLEAYLKNDGHVFQVWRRDLVYWSVVFNEQQLKIQRLRDELIILQAKFEPVLNILDEIERVLEETKE